MIGVVRLKAELRKGGSWLPVYVVCWKGEIREQCNKSNHKIKINIYVRVYHYFVNAKKMGNCTYVLFVREEASAGYTWL